MAKLKQRVGWLSAAVVVTLLSFGVIFGFGGQAQAQESGAIVAAPYPPVPARALAPQRDFERVRLAQNQGANQVFRGDLVVEPGRVMPGDVTVYSGDVTVEEGGQIQGNLISYSGDIDIESGGRIDGDVTAFSGNIEIDGHVGGNVASWSGDIDLSSTARVEGGISVLSGRIDREEGAFVGGNVVEGPELRLPGMPNRSIPVPSAPVVVDRSPGFFGWVGQLILRLIAAALLTGLVTLLTGVVAYARPETVSRVRRSMNDSLALSFVVGLITNLTLLFLAGLLSITICLLPIALVPILLLFGINLVGWTVLSQIVGERITAYIKQPVQAGLTAAVGAVALTGLLALLWAMGGCFRFIGFLAFLGIGSFGTGAVLLPWLNRGRSGGEPSGRMTPAGVAPAAPVGGVSPLTPSTPVTQEPAPDMPGTGIDEEVLKDEVGEPLDYVTAQDILAAQAEDVVDDAFVRIKGIGPVFEQRLKNAGIRTFGELAITPPERIAEIIGWPLERVIRSDLAGQARYLNEHR